ncbi:hypothetical protein B0T13DRAFT_487332 [Neurospora crassa]|nr:hypothetical protein B0T13DRAFT_487332 [Neurospora crassa]
MPAQSESFKRALARFENDVGPRRAQEFSNCSLHDVHLLMKQIQAEQEKKGGLRYLKRIESFLEAMKELGKVIEVFTNTTVFLCYVWAASTHMQSLDRLLDMYCDIEENLAGLVHYEGTLERNTRLGAVLEDYYLDVLNFHKEALAVFDRPKWKMLVDAAWKRFESKFEVIIQALKRRKELLNSEKLSASLDQIFKLRGEIHEAITKQKKLADKQEEEAHKERKKAIMGRLSIPEYQSDYQFFIDCRDESNDKLGISSGTWIFDNPYFQAWHQGDVSAKQLLYLHGKPGGGKSTLMATVIERLVKDTRPGVALAFFYFRRQNRDNNFSSLLRALLGQLYDREPVLAAHVENELSKHDGFRSQVLRDLVSTAIGTYTKTYLVLDGLDECTNDEEEKATKWLMALCTRSPGLRILFSGQRDGVLDHLLTSSTYEKLEHRLQKGSLMAKSKWEAAIKILSYVVCCKRPLFWREIQALFCVNRLTGEVDYDMRLSKSYKQLCGSFLDSHSVNKDYLYTGSEDEVHLVHETAREFLVRRKIVNVTRVHLELSIFCSQYLLSPPFAQGIGEDDVISYAKRGSYALQDYAVQYWHDHLRPSIEASGMLQRAECQLVLHWTHRFLQSYGDHTKIPALDDAGGFESMAQVLDRIPKHGGERNLYFNIEGRTEAIRQALKKLDAQTLTSEEAKIISHLHGPMHVHKCSKPWCEFFKGDLKTAEAREKHINCHDRPFRCLVEGCPMSTVGYSSSGELKKHNSRYHIPSNDRNLFPKLANTTMLLEDVDQGQTHQSPDYQAHQSPNLNSASIVTSHIYNTLTSACTQSDANIVREILAACKPNEVQKTIDQIDDITGMGPIHVSARHGNAQACMVLLHWGANPNLMSNVYGYTALHFAFMRGHGATVGLILSKYPTYRQTEEFQKILDTVNTANRADIIETVIETRELRHLLSELLAHPKLKPNATEWHALVSRVKAKVPRLDKETEDIINGFRPEE